ncbi:transposase [Mesorhizobium sp.]|uniref:IS66-like element accessory protein TnpA n=1 Tax=Mesorhizobium sp. TaxID=1871066 RepID=UPI0012174348|nr:transposase [Mesorhizobium sp.]TIN74036.1 MAG: IS66 family insertion sequence element accessory protein TnpB [Mesorhizobium sp.]
MERLEIIDSGRRRRFSREKKLQIVAESYSEPGLCATTARRHGISRSQLYEWRRLAPAWQLDVASPAGGFIPALLVPEIEPAAGSLPQAGRIEVVSANGRHVIVDRDVDVEALLRIIRGLETLR